MTKTLETTAFLDLLPDSISKDEQFVAAATALDNELQAVTGLVSDLILYEDIDTLSESVLKHLAWQWHVDFWADDLTLTQKRTLVKQAYPWHRQKGTPAAVEMVVADVLGGGSVQEWWEYGGEPYHFKVFSNQPPEDAAVQETLALAIEAAKNARSYLDGIDSPVSMTGVVYAGGVFTTYFSVIANQGD